ncbi:MFS transporter [Geobacter sp. FeAm09]|uniref:MFS transporter n=1 Tax=Geobacter sp. FeAm09 TaxID=2597769 RepID=UPI001F103269|nr:MFS transporter [Geobacter sp. FeAm09]
MGAHGMESRTLFRGLFLINFAITLGFGIADAFFSLYVFSLGARGALLGLPLVLYSLSKIVLSPFMGAWADRIGRKKVAAASLGLYLFVSLSYLFTASLPLITLLRLLQGIGCAMFRPVVLSLVGEATPDHKRATVMGTFDISFYGALSLGPVVGGCSRTCGAFRGSSPPWPSCASSPWPWPSSASPATPPRHGRPATANASVTSWVPPATAPCGGFWPSSSAGPAASRCWGPSSPSCSRPGWG